MQTVLLLKVVLMEIPPAWHMTYSRATYMKVQPSQHYECLFNKPWGGKNIATLPGPLEL